MKKIIVMIMTTILAVMSFASVSSAATKADIITELKKSTVLSGYVTKAESYLNTITVTSTQADQIIAFIKSVNTTVGLKKKLSELTSPQKLSILNDFKDAADVIDLEVEYKDGIIEVRDSSNKKVFDANTTIEDVIKQTGFDYSIMLYGFAALILAVLSGFFSRKLLLRSGHIK